MLLNFTLAALLLLQHLFLRTSAQNITLCSSNFTCPDPATRCFFDSNGLTCQPSTSTGCLASALPGRNYFTGPLVTTGSACTHCALPALQSTRQSLIDLYFVNYSDTAVTLGGLGNCNEGAYCGTNSVCLPTLPSLKNCTSVEQCQGTCRNNDRAGFPTCIAISGEDNLEGFTRLKYFGIYLGIAFAILIIIALTCFFSVNIRQRTSFKVGFVLLMLVACGFVAYAIWWEVAKWPFSS